MVDRNAAAAIWHSAMNCYTHGGIGEQDDDRAIDDILISLETSQLDELAALRAADKWLDIDPDGADIVGIKRCHLNYLVALADYCAGEGVCGPNPEMEPDEWCAAAWERYGPQGGDYSSDGLAATMATHSRPLPAPPKEI